MTDTHCPYCSLQCGMRLTGRRVPQVEEWPEFPVNGGALCRKGWSAAGLYGGRERLTTPLVRDRATGELSPVSWDDALDLVADRLLALRAERGPDTVAVFGGGGLTNEKAYQLGKLARVALGTSQIDYNGRWCMSSAASAGTRAFGLDRGLPFPLADVEQADVVVLVGSNLAETMPPAARHLDGLRARGGRVVVVDPRRTPTANRADVLVQPVPGTDLALALGVLHLLVAGGAVGEEYVATRTAGWADVRESVGGWWPERVERVTGVPADEVRALADLLAGAARVVVLTARGAEQHSTGSDTVLAWINVALALGMPGTPGAGYGCLTGQGNGQGGREHGQKADQLPGYRRIDDPEARAHVAGVWGVDPDSLPGPGRSAYELLDALGQPDGPSALLVLGSNIVVSAPRATHVTQRLESLDLLVVADLVLSETAALADVVLPVTQWAEETGTMTNLEGRVVLRQRAITPPAGVRSDLDVIAGLASRLGSPVEFATDPEVVFEELGRASAGGAADYAGITYDRIRAEHGVFWPCPEPGHPGTPRMFLDAFAHPDGRARFHVVDHRGPAEVPCADYPVHLTTGRVLAQYQSGAQTRRVRDLPDTGPFVEGLRLDTGYELSADLVVLTAGGRPSTALARRAGLMVRRGVVVDAALRSVTDETVHAIGDCAEHRNRTTGFVPPAWEQAGVLAGVLCGEDVAYDGSRGVARLRATGLDVAVLGDPLHAPGEVVEMTNPIAGSHRTLVVHGGRVVAAALVGDLSRVGLITQLYDRGTVLGPDEPGQLLLGEPASAPVHLADDAEVCACAGVTAGAVRACSSYASCRETTRATTGCGGCESVVRRLLGEDVAVPVG